MRIPTPTDRSQTQERGMRTGPVLAVLSLVVSAACSRSESANTRTSLTNRDLTALGRSSEPTAFASALELDRAVPPPHPTRATATMPVPKAKPSPRRDVTTITQPSVPVPTPEPIAPVAPVTMTPEEPAPAEIAAVPNGTGATALEPGQTVTVLTSPMSGASPTPTIPHTEIAERRRGGVIIGGGGGGGACPHGGGRGGVIGILR